MKVFFRSKDLNIRLLDNDTLKTIKSKLFSIDKFYYPPFIKIYFVKDGEKKYLKNSEETIMDNNFIGDVNVEFIGDSFTPEILTVFRIDPETISSDIEKEWSTANNKEIRFILNKKNDSSYIDNSIEYHISNSHKNTLLFVKKYDEQLKNIPKIDNLIKNIEVQNVQYELILKDKESFAKFIKNKFSSGVSEEFPFMILKTNKASKIKALDLSLKYQISKKDFLEYQMLLLLSKNGDKYIFTTDNNRLFINSKNDNVKVSGEIKDYVKSLNVLDIRYVGEISIVTDVKKFPKLINEEYSTFFKQKEYLREGNSMLLEYTRSVDPIKISVKNSKNSITTPFVIYNMNSKTHLGYVLSTIQSMFFKSISTKIQKNFFSDDDEEEVVQKKKQENIKKLKSNGVEVNSVKCQKERQPIINNDRTIKANKYDLVNKNNRFVCNKDPYLFPGFTVDENVCCFKKDQRKKEIYSRMTGNNLAKIKVRASNLVVNNKRIIKDDNGNFFYVKKYDPVVMERITDDSELQEIRSHGDKIWLKEAVLGNILYTNSKDCKKAPKLINGEYKCKNTGPLKYHFGYTESSVPCCFKEQRPVLARELEDAKDSQEYYDGKYIITTDKSIDKGRIAILPDEVYYMIEQKNVNIKNPEKNNYFRLGTKMSLLEILKSIKYFEVKDVLKESLFDLSRNTNFKTFKDLKDYISSDRVDAIKIIDYISLLLGYNIILLDFHSDDIEECVNIYGKNKEIVILIKNGNYYEIVISIGQDQKFKKLFSKNDNIVQNIKKYLEFKCSSMINELKLSFKDITKLMKNKVAIKSQVISKISRKVIFVETNDGIFLPVFPSRGLKKNVEIKLVNDVDLPIDKSKFDIFMKKYAQYYKKIDFINKGLLLNGYLVLPTKETFNEINIESLVYKDQMFKPVDSDKRLELAKKIEKQADYYYSLRYNFSRLITPDISREIESILLKSDSRQNKFNVISGIVEKISSFGSDESKYITQQLLGINRLDILEKRLAPKKIKMIKLNFSNYKQLFNWIRL